MDAYKMAQEHLYANENGLTYRIAHLLYETGPMSTVGILGRIISDDVNQGKKLRTDSTVLKYRLDSGVVKFIFNKGKDGKYSLTEFGRAGVEYVEKMRKERSRKPKHPPY